MSISLGRRGFIIPVVAVSLMVAMGIGVVHFTILNHQQKQNNLIERELTSFYIAESGFQWLFSKLKFEKLPFFKKSPNGRQDFYYSEGNNQGYFEYFISSNLKDKSNGFELDMLIKGVFTNKSGKAQDVTLLSSSMSYQKQNGEAKLTVKEKKSININKLFDYSEDKNFAKYFKSSSFLERLKSKKDLILSGSLASPDLANLWNDLISLNRVNQKIDRQIKFSQRLKNLKPNNKLSKNLSGFSSEDQALSLSKVLLQQKSFQLANSSQEIDSQVNQASQAEIENSLKESFIQGFKSNYAEHQTVILSPSNSGFLKLNQKVEMPVLEFVKLMTSLSKLMPKDSFDSFINKIDQHLSTVTEPSSHKEGKKVQTKVKMLADVLSLDIVDDLKAQNRKPNKKIDDNKQFLSVNLDFPPPLEGEVLDVDEEPLESEDAPEPDDLDEIVITPAVDHNEKPSVQAMCAEIGGETLEDGSCNQHGSILQAREIRAEHCSQNGGLFTLTVDGKENCEEGKGEGPDMDDGENESDLETPQAGPDDTVTLNTKDVIPEAYAEDAHTPILEPENDIDPDLAHELNVAQYEVPSTGAKPYNDGYQIEQIPRMDSPPLVSPTLSFPAQVDPAVAKTPTDVAKDLGRMTAQTYADGHGDDPNATAADNQHLSDPTQGLGGAPAIPLTVDPNLYSSPLVNPAIGPVENPYLDKFIIDDEGRIVDKITGAYYNGPTSVSPLTSTTFPISHETQQLFMLNSYQ